MRSLTVFHRRFTPSWQMSVLALFAIVLFSRLGFWQLGRADEKKQLLMTKEQSAQQAPILWKPGTALPSPFQSITLQGRFLSEVLLLDNQHHEHQFGYDVISPFLLENDQIILIDRGWLPGDLRRQIFPTIDIPKGWLQLSGYVYYPSKKNWSLGEIIEKKRSDLALIELIDTDLVSQFLHKSVYPFIMRLGQSEANGFIREWKVIAMSPQRHYAYALQWFSMAGLVFILFIALNLKKKHETCSS